jgi:RNA polymerase sigma-70 factor, ECF subfamily
MLRNIRVEAVSKWLESHTAGSAVEAMAELAQSLSWVRDEAELVAELQAGSDSAFDYLVTYYHSSVYNLVYGIVSDAADAADVTQEVFLRVFRGIRGFRRSSSLKTWLYRVSVRQALNHRRWCWRHHRQQVSIDADGPDNGSAWHLEDGDATPYEQCAAREIESSVRRALAEVPPVFRSAVILRDLEGLSYEEVAEILEVSVGTVKSRILRGRRMLKEILDPLLCARQVHFHDTSAHTVKASGRPHEKIHFVAPAEMAGEPRPAVAEAAEARRSEP